MNLTIISSHSVLFSGEAESVTLPGVNGSFTVLQNHAPLISVLVSGNVTCRMADGETKQIEVKGGLVDVADNKIAVCVY